MKFILYIGIIIWKITKKITKKMEQKELFTEKIENVSPQLNKILNEIERIYQSKIPMEEFEIWRKWDEIPAFFYKNFKKIKKVDIERLLLFGTRFRSFKGTDRNRIEEEFFTRILLRLYYWNYKYLKNVVPSLIMKKEIKELSKKKAKEIMEIFLELEKFALGSYEYKRSRDSFGGKRRGYSLDMSRELLNYFKDSKGLELAVRSLKSKSRDELYAAFEFLKEYYISRKKEIEPELYDLLIKIPEKTNSRSVAVGALSVLVDTENIGELHALDIIDDWKQRNYYDRY